MKSYEEILETEYSEDFDKKRKDAMVTSFYKYGMAKLNYPHNVNAIETLEKRLNQYKITGNAEWLVDVANMAMIEFMLPRHKKAHYRPTDSSENPGLAGMSIEEIKRFKESEDY